MKSVVVVTPTIGKKSLSQAIQSVAAQTYPNVKHLLVIDGWQHHKDVIVQSYGRPNTLILPDNIGKVDGKSYYGHRVYAAIGHLVNEDYVFFLDEDNWYDPHHVETMVPLLEGDRYKFVHSLRKIFSADGNFVCYDDCESLGAHPTFLNKESHLIDTSSYAFNRQHLLEAGHLWHHGWGGDRRFLSFMLQLSVPFACSGLYTLNYSLDGNPNSVTAEFFKAGNNIMQERYPNGYPWRKSH